VPPELVSRRKKFVPEGNWVTPSQFNVPTEDYYLEKLTWTGLNIPSLIHEFWFLIKWLNSANGLVYRAQITSLAFCYDSFLCHIKCDVRYDTEFFNDENKSWTLI
jgi:hypothetical protein